MTSKDRAALAFVREPPPRTLPNLQTWVYATRSHRYLLTIVLGGCAVLWLLFLAKGLAQDVPMRKALALASVFAGVFAALFAVPTWLHMRSKLREIERLLLHAELVRCAVRLSHIRSRSGRNVPVLQASSREPRVVCRWRPIPAELKALGDDDSVDVLLPRTAVAGDLAALVTDSGLWVGEVLASAESKGRERRVGLFIIGLVLIPTACLGAVCLVGSVLVAVTLFLPGASAPWSHNLPLGLFALTLSALLAVFLVSVAWKLLAYLLGRKEARYLIHPVVGVAVAGILGVCGLIVFAFTLNGRALAFGVLLLAFVGQRLNALRNERRKLVLR